MRSPTVIIGAGPSVITSFRHSIATVERREASVLCHGTQNEPGEITMGPAPPAP